MMVLALPICVLFVLALGVTALNDRARERRRAIEDPDSLLDDGTASASPSPSPSPSDQ